ncbi:MAG: HTTM domain-containing protein [Thermoleophilaceae bacterium]
MAVGLETPARPRDGEAPRVAGRRPTATERLFAPVDNASLVAFRVAVGALLFWETLRYVHYGWITEYWVEPTFFFTFQGFDWVTPWPGSGMYLHFMALGSLALCVASGFFYRITAALFTIGFAYVFLLDKANYLNHFYLIVILSFLLVVVPAHRRFSLDVFLRPGLRSTTAPTWALWLLRAQVGLVYAFGGIAKLNGDWLAGRPMDTWLAEHSGAPIVGPLLDQPWSGLVFSYGGLAFDLLVVPALLWRRTRPYALGAAIAFHLANTQLFSIGVFPWFMIAATTLFLDPDWPVRALAAVRGRLPGVRAGAPAGAGASRSGGGASTAGGGRGLALRRAGIAALAVFLAFQVLVPFRHLLYPGSVYWTEEGHRFSWHMKLRDKSSDLLRVVARGADGRTLRVEPRRYVTENQLDEMATRPDMLQQFARHVAGDLERRGLGRTAIHVNAEVSLNGRPPQPMIDPRVDLARTPRDLRHASWILPLSPAQ